jgi:hypothetical protein
LATIEPSHGAQEHPRSLHRGFAEAAIPMTKEKMIAA